MILSALITTAVVIGSLFAIAADGRHGNSDPWWAYLLVVGFGLAIGPEQFRIVAWRLLMRRSTAGVMLTVTLVLAAMDAAQAQAGSRTIKGTVVDSANHKPVSQAVIHLGRMPTGQRTGDDGTFRVSASQGRLVLMVRRSGYVPALIAIHEDTAASEMDLGTTRMLKIETDDDRAAVQNVDVIVYPELAQFYDHKVRYRQGLFLTPDDLQRVGGSLFTLIRQKPNFHFICFATRRGEWDCGQQASRGRTSIMNPNPRSAEQEPCELEVWTDALGPQRTLDEIQMDDVLAIEAYPHPGVTPQEFSGSSCAAVMLWMKQAGQVTTRPRG